jgi:hypothetical protein
VVSFHYVGQPSLVWGWLLVLWTNPLEFWTANFTYPRSLWHYTLLGRAMLLEYLRRDISWLASSYHCSVSVSQSYCSVSHFCNAPHLFFCLITEELLITILYLAIRAKYSSTPLPAPRWYYGCSLYTHPSYSCQTGLLGAIVYISCLGVSRGVHNIMFSLSPDSFYYYTWIWVLTYYKNTLYYVTEALSFSWNLFPDF